MPVVATNANGYRIGEDHQRARLSDKQIDEMRDLREEQGWGWRRLARHFSCSKWLVRRVCSYELRAQTIEGHRVIKTEPEARQSVVCRP